MPLRDGTAFSATAPFFSGRRSSPIDQCSDIAPRTSGTLTTLDLAPSSVFAVARRATAIPLLALHSGAALDRLRLVSARRHHP
jgi:hypothetical protein